MSNIKLSSKDISLFTLDELCKYLRFFGFSKQSERKNTFEYQKYFTEFDETINLLVPKTFEIVNYYESVFSIFEVISSIEHIEVKEIINKIVAVSNDIIRMQLINIKNNSRSIPLDIAAEEVESLSRLIIYGASSEEKARPFFEKPTTIGINHGNQCQFGHTFEGSFGFSVNSPLIDDYTQLTFEKETIKPPFERKVIERIATGFLNTQNALKVKSINPIVDDFENGFNSRMCDAIIDMSTENANILKFSIEWSPQVETKLEFKSINEIYLKPDSIELLKDASKALKTVEPFDDTIIGRIITLHSNKSPFLEEEFPRVAVIRHTFENHPIDVKLELNMEQYKKAYIAHGEGSTIKATGKIFRKGNTWRMIDIVSIDIFHS